MPRSNGQLLADRGRVERAAVLADEDKTVVLPVPAPSHPFL
jgi:hypothetical protein